MDYQERIRLITDRLNDFLQRYQRPAHLDTDGSLAEIRATADEINSLIPASSNHDDLAARVEACFRRIRQTYTQRTWPMVAHFVRAMGEAHSQDRAPVVGELDRSPMQIAADRMTAGEPVGDTWLYGVNARELLASGLVTRDTVRQYRSGLYFAAKDVGGIDYARELEGRLIMREEQAEGRVVSEAVQ